ncbi:MAG: hypothetical protein CM15mV29_0640 [uncultured marine virus]|jgi:hypothetical protein|nr:MAG: hypothetical protein CM15mV29_0640 [uncultured marine virus]
MGMSGQLPTIKGTPFSKRLTEIEDLAYDMKKQAQDVSWTTMGIPKDTKSLLVLIVENWKEDRIRELVSLTVGKERIEDVTQAEIDNLPKVVRMEGFRQ